MPPRAISASRLMRCAAGISSSRRRCRTRRRPARSTTPANSPARWRARRRLPTGTASTSARRSRERAGRLRGIGIATYIEACGNNGPETATLTLDRDGGVTLLIGSQSTGQGHATSYAQLIAEHLDLPPERVRMVQGDTDRIKTGAGTGGSSSIPVGGVSVDRAAKTLAEQLKDLAADALEASVERSRNRRWRRARGRHRSRHFVCRSRRASERVAREAAARRKQFSVEPPTYPNGTHIAEVEIDPDDRRDGDPELRRGR